MKNCFRKISKWLERITRKRKNKRGVCLFRGKRAEPWERKTARVIGTIMSPLTIRSCFRYERNFNSGFSLFFSLKSAILARIEYNKTNKECKLTTFSPRRS